MPLSAYSVAASSSSHRPFSSRYLNANRCETGRVTLTLLVPLLRGLSGWTNGSQPLKSPTTDTLPAVDSLGRTKLTLTFLLPFTGVCLITPSSLTERADIAPTEPQRLALTDIRADPVVAYSSECRIEMGRA